MNIALIALASFLALNVFVDAAEEGGKLITIQEPSAELHQSLANEAIAAITRSLDRLATLQKPDGSWSDGNFPALTALAAWPFIYSTHPQKEAVLDKALNYIKSCAQEDGGIYKTIPDRKGGGLSNYNTAICMTVLHEAGRSDCTAIVLKARRFIADTQYLGDDVYRGGFGYDRNTQRPYTDLLNTYYAVEAMRFTQNAEELRDPSEKKADINWNETIKYLEKMQNKPDTGENAGGFFYNPTDPKGGAITNAEGKIIFQSYGSITYSGMLALMYANVAKDDPRITSAFDWATKHWSLDENPGMGGQGLFFFYNVLTKCLNSFGRDVIPLPDKTMVKWRVELANKLISTQKIDPKTGGGYWVNEVNRYWEGDEVLTSAYSTLALQLASGLGVAPKK